MKTIPIIKIKTVILCRGPTDHLHISERRICNTLEVIPDGK